MTTCTPVAGVAYGLWDWRQLPDRLDDDDCSVNADKQTDHDEQFLHVYQQVLQSFVVHAAKRPTARPRLLTPTGSFQITPMGVIYPRRSGRHPQGLSAEVRVHHAEDNQAKG